MSNKKKESENPFEDIPSIMPRVIVGETYSGPKGETYVCTKYSIERFYDELVVEMKFVPKSEFEEEEGE